MADIVVALIYWAAVVLLAIAAVAFATYAALMLMVIVGELRR